MWKIWSIQGIYLAILLGIKRIKELLHVIPDDIVLDNPYFQKHTTQRRGCQIDYLIQTKYNALYLCEIKFSKRPITTSVIKEVQTKIAAINSHKRYSIWPVLIHVNGVSQAVIDAGFFARFIDFSDLLSARNSSRSAVFP